MMILAFFARLPRWAWLALAGAGMAGALLLLTRCGDGDAGKQIEQSTRSSVAASQAAQDAIETLEDRTATEATIDAAVSQAVKEIDRAQDSDAVRRAVVASVCRQASHSRDAACRVR